MESPNLIRKKRTRWIYNMMMKIKNENKNNAKLYQDIKK